MKRTGHLLIVAASALAACVTSSAPPPAKPPAPSPTPTTSPAAPATPQPPAPPPAGPALPASPAAQQQAQKHAQLAVDLLETGSVDQARVEIKNALGLDPQNKLALSLTRQLDADPVATLGRESFAYTVRPSDTMSKIAGRFLGDVYSFYILARYNGIREPRQLAIGQVIRVPGKAPPPESSLGHPAPTPAPPSGPTPGEVAMSNAVAAEQAGDLKRALIEYVSAAGYGQTGASAKADQLRAQLVGRYSADARAALARQDLDGAATNWGQVLDLDPKNPTARLELDRVRQLKQKLQEVK